jgi:predicted transcriptional regulator
MKYGQIRIRVDDDIKHKAQQLANADRRSVSAWVRNMIEREWGRLPKDGKQTILPNDDK